MGQALGPKYAISAALANSGLTVRPYPILVLAWRQSPSFHCSHSAVSYLLLNHNLLIVECRFFQKQIQLAFMMRLTRHLHRLYCSNRSLLCRLCPRR